MGLQKQAAHRNIWWIGTPCPTFCSTSPRSVLCWAALHPFIFTKNVLLSWFISLENTCPPPVDVKDSDPQSLSTSESLKYSAETHCGSVAYGWHMMLWMSIKSYLSWHWMLPSPDYTSESKVEKTMLWGGLIDQWFEPLYAWHQSCSCSSWVLLPLLKSSLGKGLRPEVLRCSCRCAASYMYKTHLLKVQILLPA